MVLLVNSSKHLEKSNAKYTFNLPQNKKRNKHYLTHFMRSILPWYQIQVDITSKLWINIPHEHKQKKKKKFFKKSKQLESRNLHKRQYIMLNCVLSWEKYCSIQKSNNITHHLIKTCIWSSRQMKETCLY